MLNEIKILKFSIILLVLIKFNKLSCLPFSSLTCNFDTYQSPCSWELLKTTKPYDWKWMQFNTRTVNLTGPLGPVGNRGSFIQTYKRNTNSKAITESLLSPMINPTNTSSCFSFYYYIVGENVGKLELKLINDIQTLQTPIWLRALPAGDMWHQYMVNIPPLKSSFKLKFEVYSGEGIIALDEFIGSTNECPFNGICDFESGMCGWTANSTSQSHQYKFRRISGLEETDPSQQIIDHTTETQYGHFMQTYMGLPNDITMLISQTFTPTLGPQSQSQCLHFWYLRQSNNLHKIDIFMIQNGVKIGGSLWTSNLTFPTHIWHRSSVTLRVGQRQNIAIQATYLNTNQIAYTPISIDDISIKPGLCPLPIFCDFNKDLCGFVREYDFTKLEWIWDHGFGRVENASKLPFYYPPRDRTAAYDGMFMYTDFTGIQNGQSFTMRLDSEYVSPTNSACLEFYHKVMVFNEINSKFSIVAIDSSGNIINNPLWTYSTSTDRNTQLVYGLKQWVKVQVNIQSQKEFKLSFRVQTSNASTYLAIDDISYNFGACSGPTLPPKLTTMPPSVLLFKPNCDFETASNCLANWKIDPVNAWKISGQSNKYLLPQIDHTKQNNYGRYLYLLNPSYTFSTFNTPSANMTSVADNYYSGKKVCFKLWYFMRTSKFAKLVVNVTAERKYNIERYGDHGEKWNLLQFEFTEMSANIQVFVSAQVVHGVVAIDDIMLTIGVCNQLSNRYECNFEDKQNCGFTPLLIYPYSNLFHLYQANETVIKTFDHTFQTLSGHFVGIDISKTSTSLGNTFRNVIQSQTFAPTKGACITFSYYMRGLSKNETLSFYIRKSTDSAIEMVSNFKPLWSVSGEQGPFWYTHRQFIVSDLQWSILFKVVANNTLEGLIAIDDVIVDLDKKCPPIGKCDFENGDTCTWEVNSPGLTDLIQAQKHKWTNTELQHINTGDEIYYTSLLWQTHSPIHGDWPLFPITDNTLKTKNGNYLLLSPDNGIVQIGTLMSDSYDLDASRQLCLRFYYQFRGFCSNCPNIFVYYNEFYGNSIRNTYLFPTNANRDRWMPYNITIKANYANTTSIRLFIMGKTGDAGSTSSIDDISVENGQCGGNTVINNNRFNCTNTESIPKSKVCDHITDCSNGLDEKNCEKY